MLVAVCLLFVQARLLSALTTGSCAGIVPVIPLLSPSHTLTLRCDAAHASLTRRCRYSRRDVLRLAKAILHQRFIWRLSLFRESDSGVEIVVQQVIRLPSTP